MKRSGDRIPAHIASLSASRGSYGARVPETGTAGRAVCVQQLTRERGRQPRLLASTAAARVNKTPRHRRPRSVTATRSPPHKRWPGLRARIGANRRGAAVKDSSTWIARSSRPATRHSVCHYRCRHVGLDTAWAARTCRLFRRNLARLASTRRLLHLDRSHRFAFKLRAHRLLAE